MGKKTINKDEFVRVGYGAFSGKTRSKGCKSSLRNGDCVYVETPGVEMSAAFHRLPVHKRALMGMKHGRLEYNPDGRSSAAMETAMSEALTEALRKLVN